MTGPAIPDPLAELRAVLERASRMLSTRALERLDASVPSHEYAEISLSVREWLVLTTTMDRFIVFSALTKPDILTDPLVARGIAAFETLLKRFETINAAAAGRRQMETGR